MTANVEVLGIGATNKGAWLMLEAIKQEFQRRLPDARIALNLDFPIRERLAHGVWTCLRSEQRTVSRRMQLGFRVIPSQVKIQLGLIEPENIDVIFDASGFAYGDFWGAEKVRLRILKRVAAWKSLDRVAIMLPQAFGPFSDPEIARIMPEALAYFDLVFARDRTSLEHLRAVAPAHPGIGLAPDFTNLLSAPPMAPGSDLSDRALIIPNSKMLQGGQKPGAGPYHDFLRTAAVLLAGRGARPAFLIHEGADDLQIAEAVNQSLPARVPIIQKYSALDIKAAIGSARLVVSSRFHGLVSALSSGVPAIACGWSHKYAELMHDYGCSRFNLTLEPGGRHGTALERLLDEADRPGFRRAISERAGFERRRSTEMWSRVEAAIRLALPRQTLGRVS